MELIYYLNKNNIKYENTSEGLTVDEDLYLRGCTGLKSLPDNLQVKGCLYLRGCTLYTFDESKLKITGDYNIILNSYRFIVEG